MTMKKHFLGMKKNNIFLACIFVLLIGIAVAITVYSLLNDKILFIFLIWILVVIYIVIWVVYFSLVTIDNENITRRRMLGKRFNRGIRKHYNRRNR